MKIKNSSLWRVVVVSFLASRLVCATEAVPEFTDKPAFWNNINMSGGEPETQLVCYANGENIAATLRMDSKATRDELKKRIAAKDSPQCLKLIYAGVLAGLGDHEGQVYLLERGRTAGETNEARDIFWVIGNLESFATSDEDKEIKSDINWAEPFMLEMLSQPKKLKSAYSDGESYDRQALALNRHVGRFGEILAAMNSPKLYPILQSLWNDRTIWIDHGEILNAFGELKDERAVPILLQALREHREYPYAAHAVRVMAVKEAIPILLERLNDLSTYDALPAFDDPRILPAIKKALPELKDEVQSTARVMVIDLEGGDKLPRFLELANDPTNKSLDVMYRIAKLKDERSISLAIKVLDESKDLCRTSLVISMLAGFKKSDAAIQALINALGIDFAAMAYGSKDMMNDNNERYRARIAGYLNEMTGEDFGTDQKKWLEYARKKIVQPKEPTDRDTK
jgi:HEAT repeat protein